MIYTIYIFIHNVRALYACNVLFIFYFCVFLVVQLSQAILSSYGSNYTTSFWNHRNSPVFTTEFRFGCACQLTVLYAFASTFSLCPSVECVCVCWTWPSWPIWHWLTFSYITLYIPFGHAHNQNIIFCGCMCGVFFFFFVLHTTYTRITNLFIGNIFGFSSLIIFIIASHSHCVTTSSSQVRQQRSTQSSLIHSAFDGFFFVVTMAAPANSTEQRGRAQRWFIVHTERLDSDILILTPETGSIDFIWNEINIGINSFML